MGVIGDRSMDRCAAAALSSGARRGNPRERVREGELVGCGDELPFAF